MSQRRGTIAGLGTGTNGETATRDDQQLVAVPGGATIETVLSCAKRGIERRRTGDLGGGEPLVAITQTGVHVLPDGAPTEPETAVSFTHASIEAVDAGGLVRRHLDVTTDEATYVFHVDGRPGIEEIGDFLEGASRVWEAVLPDLQGVRRAVAIIGQELDADNVEGLDKRYLAATESLASARERASDTVVESGVETAAGRLETQLRRQRARWHYKYGQRLVNVGADRYDGADIAAARRAYERACEHYQRALSIIEADGFAGADRVHERLSVAETAIEDLESDPLAEALAACHRAADAEDDFTAWESWKQAREQYRAELNHRNSLLAVERLRYQLAWVEANYVAAARAHAGTLESRGNDHLVDGNDTWARELYMGAVDVLNEAITVARDQTGCDPTALREYRDRIEAKGADIATE